MKDDSIQFDDTPAGTPVSVPSADVTSHGFHTKPVPKAKRGLMASVILISVIVHLVAIAIFAAIKVAQAIVEEPAFEAVKVVNNQEVKKKEQKQKVEQRQRAGGSPPKTVITVNRSTSFEVPQVDVKVNNPNGKLGGRGEGKGFGDGIGDGTGSGVGGMGGLKKLMTTIGGIQVEAERLGVVVDNSGSMKPYLEDLRKDINRKFKDRSEYVEANGCAITPTSAAFRALKAMAEGGKVDAIFWFSDLNDPYDMTAIETLGEILLEKKIKLYIRSIKMEADEDTSLRKNQKKEGKRLIEISKESGGKYKVDKM